MKTIRDFISNTEFERRVNNKMCIYCGSELIKYRESGPDFGTLYFCNMKHYQIFYKTYLHRATNVEKLI